MQGHWVARHAFGVDCTQDLCHWKTAQENHLRLSDTARSGLLFENCRVSILRMDEF